MQALILVDLQNDFLPGGALAVPRGDEVLPVANRLAAQAPFVVATMDWHPPDHVSFGANHPEHEIGELITVDGVPQVLWPIHCVQDSNGAELAAALDQSRFAAVIYKGELTRLDSYSGFFDNSADRENLAARPGTGLAKWLREHDIDEVYVLGLATDYCVKATALDSQALGFRTFVVTDGCRGVDLQPGDSQQAFADMQQAGIVCLNSAQALERLAS